MLPPFIIQQIRKREDEERKSPVAPQPSLELPLPPRSAPARSDRAREEPQRGVVVIDL